MKFDIITIGGAVRDVTFYTNEGKVFSTPQDITAQRLLAFEYGAKISIKEAYLNLGGGAANSAVALARLGCKVAVITKIGHDENGLGIIKKFKQEGINTNFIQVEKKLPTGFSFILATEKKEREHIAFVYRGASESLTFNQKDYPNLDCNWIYLSSLSGKSWLKNLKAIFNFATGKNIKIYWNPGNLQLKSGKRILADFLKQTNILVLNKDEAIELVLSGIKLGRKNPNCLNRPLYLLNILQEWGPKIVVITDGVKGAWAYDGRKIYQQKIFKAKVVDTTGVGDSFGASFLAGLIINKNNIVKALKWGMINSASVVTKVGAQNGLLNRKKLEEKL